MNVNCDYCHNEFQISLNKVAVQKDIERNYFTCPHCKNDFTSFYTNKSIRGKQIKSQKLWEKFHTTKTINKKENIQKQVEKLKEEIRVEIEELKVKF
jgi:transcriptional regulator NrdR family protein